MIVEIAGPVPTSELRDVVRRMAEREVSRREPHYRIVDRLEIAGASPAA